MKVFCKIRDGKNLTAASAGPHAGPSNSRTFFSKLVFFLPGTKNRNYVHLRQHLFSTISSVLLVAEVIEYFPALHHGEMSRKEGRRKKNTHTKLFSLIQKSHQI